MEALSGLIFYHMLHVENSWNSTTDRTQVLMGLVMVSLALPGFSRFVGLEKQAEADFVDGLNLFP